jgi:hypothetical protein
MPTRLLCLLRSLPVLLLAALVAPPAFGLAQRTFVASYGNDANPCSLASPCRSFGAAIAQVIAGGEVIVLDSAGYGPTVITQSVSIIAPAGVYAGISVISPANTIGVDINGAGIKVVLQNIAINALGGTYGIQVQQAAEVDVNGCAISNFTGAGIYSTAANARLNVRDTLVRDGAGPGIWLYGSTRAVLEWVRIVHNGSIGVFAQLGSDVSVKRSVLAGNANTGLEVQGGSAVGRATVEDSLIADNMGYGLAAASSGLVAELTAARNTITRNARGVGAVPVGLHPSNSAANLSDNLITQNVVDGVMAVFPGAVISANNNTFAGNGSSALNGASGGTVHTIKGADGLPNNSGEQTTPTIGSVVPTNPF